MQTGFIAIVFAMIAVAAAFVLLPLWKGARRTAIAVGLILPVATVLLYAKIGNPLALDPARRNAGITAEQELDGWVQLARSRKDQQRYPEALTAYVHALKLDPDEPELLVEIAETMTLADSSHHIGDAALKLLQHARSLDPANQRALWFLGIAAYQQQRYAEAATTWQALLVLVPEQTRSALRQQIDEARVKAGLPPLPAEVAVAAGPILLNVRVDISSALRARLAPADTLFVFARVPDGPPMPLAVKRVPARDFPLTLTLADADGPMPTMRLSQQKTVTVVARVSHSGDALPQSGDFEAAPSPATVGKQDPIALTIDSIHP